MYLENIFYFSFFYTKHNLRNAVEEVVGCNLKSDHTVLTNMKNMETVLAGSKKKRITNWGKVV